jgi:hypothetical protein
MNTILDQYSDQINGTFSFFDRLIIKGHIFQFYSDSGKKHFLSYNDILLKDFPAYANKVTDSLVSHIENMTAGLDRPLIYLASARTSKEATAKEVLADNPIDEGLICTLSTVEYCSTLQPKKNEKGLLYLAHVNRKCKYFYCYFMDKHFGFMHVKIQTWFPFLIQVYINGRELMKQVLDENNISYQMYDNSFTYLSDTDKAQKLADSFDSQKLCRQLDFFAGKLNNYLDIIRDSFGCSYHWCVDQCEYATDVMFKSREALEDIYPSLVEHAFYSFKCTDVFSFLGRKLDLKFQGEAVSDYRKRPEGWRIKHRMKSNCIKMYDKSSVLRIEMTINDPKEFKIYKKVNHRDGSNSMRWSPMGKSISNLYRYAEISKAANQRYLSSLVNIIPKAGIEKEVRAVCSHKQKNQKRFTGFNVWEQETFQLFEELCDAKYLIRGFTNKDIRRAVYKSHESESKSSRNRITRLFGKLRVHGLIRKTPHSLRYHLTEKGRRVMSAIIQTQKRIYPVLAS